jgi:ATP-dependent NAD(P)H-hydrate dehydratase
LNKDQLATVENCQALARKLDGVTIVAKGATDIITDGDVNHTFQCSIPGTNKRCAGQGDTLAGTLGTFLAWAQAYESNLWDHAQEQDDGMNTSLAAYGACAITRTSANKAFELHGRAMQASDIVDQVGAAYSTLFS